MAVIQVKETIKLKLFNLSTGSSRVMDLFSPVVFISPKSSLTLSAPIIWIPYEFSVGVHGSDPSERNNKVGEKIG